jgi:NHLM bacteriocin system ABC transporter peptidase/ATP-binding protein
MAESTSEPNKTWKNRRVKTPTVLQMEAVECGAAALGMILGYHGRYVPLERLRVECGVSRDGSKASNMLKAARKYGLTAKGFKKEPEDLRELSLPMILFWNFNHFIVLEGIRDQQAYINDPGNGPRVITVEELDQSFTGVVLTFEPGPEFRKGGEKPSVTKALTRRLKGSKSPLLFVLLAGLLLVIPGLAVPTYSKIFIDDVLVGERGHIIIRPLLLAMGITATLMAVLTWLQQYYLQRLQAKLALSTSAGFFRHVLRLPVEFFTQRFGGEIGSRVQINDRVAQLLSGDLANNMLNVIMVIFYAALMVQYSIVLTLVGVFIALLNFVALRYVSRKRVDLNQKLLQDQGKLLGTTMSGLQMIESLKASGSESDFYAQWSGYQAKVMNAQQELGFSTQMLSSIPPLLSSLNNVAILGLGAFLIINGELSIGMLVAFQALMVYFINPFTQMVNLGGEFQEVQGDMNRLDDVLHYPGDKQFSLSAGEESADFTSPKLSGRLELKNIAFGYNILEEPLIQDFKLTLKPGERVALVGGSGSGKSTAAKLVAGLNEPWEGEVLFDGKPRSAIPRAVMCNSVAMVDQDIFMFSGTIRENLTLWDSTISEADVIQACKDACIHDDVAARPGGYDSLLDEGGSNFSGGQRQRLEIARALVMNPSIIVLDEATSALDPNTEKVIDENLRRRGITCLIIAHRLSTIRDCDEIIVLERGKVVQRGTHEEMMRDADSYYARLIHSE